VILAFIGIEVWNPGFRGLSNVAVNITPVVIALASVILLAFIVRQAWDKFINSSLQLKITVWMGATLTIVAVILIAYSAITSRQEAIRFAESDILSDAKARAGFLRAEAEIPLDTARALAHALTAVRNPDTNLSMSRDQVNAMLYQVLLQNRSFLGTYTLWEPNAFDGLDVSFRNQLAHDTSGRFIPYWVRGDDGSISVIALEQYETPGIGDWYLLPRQTKKEVTVAPLIYPIQGVDTVMASFVVPVVYEGEFYGIVGIDAPISFVQEIVDAVDLYDGSAQAIVLTASGTLVGVSGQPELINQPASQVFADFAILQPRIEAREAFTSLSEDGQYLRVFAPINIGQTDTPWSFILVVPFAKVTAEATNLAMRQIIIGIVLTVLALALVWLLSSRIVRPLRALTDVAVAISQGNLDMQAQVDAKDETGTLATAFNRMTSQLRDFISTLESRVAERTRNLELAAEVGRTVSQVRALDVMLKDAAELIRAQFDLYYVQVYLVNPAQTHLTLQAGTGEVGAALLSRQHQLPLNTGSINGRAAIEKRPEVISNTANSTVFKPNPLLPETRSEMAVPLMIGDRVVGVLDMQSENAGSLNQDVLPAFEALAGQLAIAIQNANLLAEAEQARAEVETQARRLVRASWQDYMDALHRPEQTGFVFEQNQVTPLDSEAASQEQPDALTAPISLTGEQLGSLVVEVEQERQTPQTVELVKIVARQVAQQIENLRLLETAERYRFDAEQAARRLTREGWEEYFSTKAGQSLSYLYDLNEVRPQEPDEAGLNTESALSIPIKVRDETIGKLAILDVDSDNLDVLELVNTVSERLSQHIESLRLLEETQLGQLELNRRARQLAAVSQISTVSSRELDIQKMLATVVQMTQREFGLYHAHVFTYNERAGHLEIVACGWKEGDENEGSHETTIIPLDQEQSLVARAARSRQPVVVNDVRSEPGWLPNPLLPDTASELAVPLVIGDEVLGVLDVQSEHLNTFTEENINIQATLAAQVATALQNARSFSRAQRQAEREAMLNAISQKIQSATSVEAVLQIAARELGHALGAPRTIAQLSMKDNN
jgi:methyl-accepting chemotaxis protein